MTTLLQDIRYAFRQLTKGWMISGITVVSLGLAIGGNTIVFSLVDGLLFLPLPYETPEQLVHIGEVGATGRRNQGPRGASLATLADLTERSRTISEWGGARFGAKILRGTERATVIPGGSATAGFFTTLGISGVRGRLFLPEETVEGAPHVAVLSHDYWVRELGAPDDQIGKIMTIDGAPHEVVGILPEDFFFQGRQADIWTPITESPRAADRNLRNVWIVGRMVDGMTTERVRSEMVAQAQQLEEDFPDEQRGWTLESYNMRTDLPTGSTRSLVALLQGSVLLALIIACVNTFNLLIAKGQERSREVALRSALGATKGRLIRQLFTESSILVIVAAVLGISFASVGIRSIAARFATVLPPNLTLTMNSRVLVFTLLVSAATGVLFGLIPAFRTFQNGQAGALKEGGRGGGTRKRRLLSRGLVVTEIALSFVALGGGSLLVKSFRELRNDDPGFDTTRILTASINIPASRFTEDEQRLRLYDDILEAVGQAAGVTNATVSASLPFSFSPPDSFRVVGAELDPSAKAPTAGRLSVGPSYLDVMEGSLLQGRFLEITDRADSPPVVVVNRTLAETHFPGGTALGEHLEIGDRAYRVVGVISDITEAFVQTPGSTSDNMYLAVAQDPSRVGFLLVRTLGDARAIKEPLRLIVQNVDRDLALSSVRTIEENSIRNLSGISVFNMIFGGFGIMALVLAAIGTYGVLSYSVTQRRHEIGIRMSVGSTPREVVKLIASEGILMGILGLAIGAALTVPLVGVVRSLLQSISTVEPGVLFLVGTVLAGVTTVATMVPAVRATRVDPVQTLKGEGRTR